MKISNSELQKLTVAMEAENLSISQVIELIKKSNFQSEKVIDIDIEINLVVDYTKTVKQAIADGNYDWINGDINDKNFGTNQIGASTEITKLFNFNRDINSEYVITEMDKAGYRPATLMELLALGAAHLELQRRFTIVALGSVWFGAHDFLYVPCLSVSDSESKLILYWFGGDWSACYGFLGVRK